MHAKLNGVSHPKTKATIQPRNYTSVQENPIISPNNQPKLQRAAHHPPPANIPSQIMPEGLNTKRRETIHRAVNMLKSLKSTNDRPAELYTGVLRGTCSIYLGGETRARKQLYLIKGRGGARFIPTACGAAGDAQSGFWWDGSWYYGGNMWLWNASEDYRMNIIRNSSGGWRSDRWWTKLLCSEKCRTKTPVTFKWHWRRKHLNSMNLNPSSVSQLPPTITKATTLKWIHPRVN